MATSDNLSWRVVLTIEASALVCGTVYSLTRKFMNLTKAEGFAGNTTYFRHPLFQGLWCFLGQLFAWPIWWRMEQRERRRRQAAGGTRYVPLGEQPTSRRAAVLCMLPTLFDVIGTVLNNIGLILTSVSVYQMLRGSVVLFTSLASRLLLKTRFTTKQLQGLVMVAIGVCFIGMVRTCYGLRIR
jgi:drug/metabolite transporter (DMT)-like permease